MVNALDPRQRPRPTKVSTKTRGKALNRLTKRLPAVARRLGVRVAGHVLRADALAQPGELRPDLARREVQVDHRVVALVVLPELVVRPGQPAGEAVGLRPRFLRGLVLEALEVGQGQVVVEGRGDVGRRPGVDALLVPRDGGGVLAPRELDVGQVVEREAVRRRRAQDLLVDVPGVQVPPRLLVLDGEQVLQVAVRPGSSAPRPRAARWRASPARPRRRASTPGTAGSAARAAAPPRRLTTGPTARVASSGEDRHPLLDRRHVDEEDGQPPQRQPAPALERDRGQQQHGHREAEGDRALPAAEGLLEVVPEQRRVPQQHGQREHEDGDEQREQPASRRGGSGGTGRRARWSGAPTSRRRFPGSR